MTERSQQEIAEEVKALKALKSTVREFTGFGDSNHSAIDAQIAVLEELQSHDDIYDLYGENEDEGLEADQHCLDAALSAYSWLNEGGDAPSKGWVS